MTSFPLPDFLTPRKSRSSTLSTEAESERPSSPQLLEVPHVVLLPSPYTVPLGQVVARNATADSFSAFVEANGKAKGLLRKFFLREGCIILTEVVATGGHQAAVSNIIMQVGQYNLAQTNTYRPLDAKGDYLEDIDEEEESMATPDCIIRLRSVQSRPSVVVEVLYSNGGVRNVKNLAEMYLSPTSRVEMFIGLKLMYPASRQAPDRFRACAFVFRKDHGLSPVDIISFGTVDLTQQQRAHIAEVMQTPFIRGCAPAPPCCADHDYFVDVPWEVFVAGLDQVEIDIPWIAAEDSHALRLSLFLIQDAVSFAFGEMRRIPLFPHDDHDHLRQNP